MKKLILILLVLMMSFDSSLVAGGKDKSMRKESKTKNFEEAVLQYELRNFEEAVKLFTNAIETCKNSKNKGFAAFMLAQMYLNGMGCEKDALQALKFCQLALKLGFPVPQVFTTDIFIDLLDKQARIEAEQKKWDDAHKNPPPGMYI
jgi:tetratricopeptide (TPR) repeat protein